MAHRAPHQLPQGVLDAEREARESQIAAEHRAGELRIIEKALQSCPHEDDEFHTVRTIGDSFSDNEVSYGKCLRCGLWLVRTICFSKRGTDAVEDRPMTHAERLRYDSQYAMEVEFAKPDRVIGGMRFPRND